MNSYRFLFVCPDVKSPVGGIKMIYEICKEFNQCGLTAFVVHSNPATKMEWFNADSPTVYNSSLFPPVKHQQSLKKTVISILRKVKNILSNNKRPKSRLGYIEVDWNNDVFIYPERWVVWAFKTLHAKKIVCFNQNVYKYLYAENYNRHEILSAHKLIKHHFVVSDDSLKYLNLLFRDTLSKPNLIRVRCYVNTELFKPLKKKNQVCFMSRKSIRNSQQVLNFIEPALEKKGWLIKDIHKIPQKEAAVIMGESKLFLSFSETEGFGLPPVEALSAGCCVIGFHGEGGREYFNTGPFIEAVESDNIIDYAEKIIEWIDKLENTDFFQQASLAARAFVIENYAKEVSSAFNQAQITRFVESVS